MEQLEPIDYQIRLKCLTQTLFDLRSEECDRLLKLAECYLKLLFVKTYAGVSAIKKEFDAKICKAAWELLAEDRKNQIKEMKDNDPRINS